MVKVLNARVRELCGVPKGVDERLDEGGSGMWRLIDLFRSITWLGVDTAHIAGEREKAMWRE